MVPVARLRTKASQSGTEARCRTEITKRSFIDNTTVVVTKTFWNALTIFELSCVRLTFGALVADGERVEGDTEKVEHRERLEAADERLILNILRLEWAVLRPLIKESD